MQRSTIARLSSILLALGLTLSFLLALPARSAPDTPRLPDWQAKVDTAVSTAIQDGEAVEFLIFLQEQADLSPAGRIASRARKGAFVYRQLEDTARRTQAPLIRILESAGAEYRAYWIANMIWVRGDTTLVRRLAQRDDVAHLYANPRLRLPEPVRRAPASRLPVGIEWGLEMVNAPDVWAREVTGEGIVVGGQDTGYHWNHPALIDQYRGWNGVTVDHNYNWHDAIHADSNTGGSSSCGVDLQAPCDDHGHGTHTMGTMVGDDGAGNQIGMAPGARWIGCRNMEGGWGTPATYSECFQWFVAPTDLNGLNPDPTRAPHVINNSWTCPPSEGCTDPTVLKAVVENVRAAGIVVVVSAGNAGSACGSISTPPAIYDAAYTVGATDDNDTIAGFSSRGPVTVDGSNRLKPDVSAPGVSVRSSIPPATYGTMSGTSMAGPHVAGQIALLLSAYPAWIGHVDALESLINDTAVPRTTFEGCGGDSSTAVPNHTYGYGRIDALAALDGMAPSLTLTKTVALGATGAGQTLTYTLSLTNAGPLQATTNVVLTDVIPSGTTFLTATAPFTREQGMVSWYAPSLAAGANWQVELVVRVSVTVTGTPSRYPALVWTSRGPDVALETEIVNDDYGARSDQARTSGYPVVARFAPLHPPIFFLPLIRSHPTPYLE